MGFRYILLALAVYIIISVGKRLYINRLKTAEPKAQTEKPSVDMKQCAFCGTHLPVDETIQRDGHYFCNQQHWLAWQKK